MLQILVHSCAPVLLGIGLRGKGRAARVMWMQVFQEALYFNHPGSAILLLFSHSVDNFNPQRWARTPTGLRHHERALNPLTK